MTDGLSGCDVGALEERIETLEAAVERLEQENQELRTIIERELED